MSSVFGPGGEAAAIAVDPDGRLAVAGSVLTGNTRLDFFLARYGLNGLPDSSFGSGGFVNTDFSGRNDIATAVALQPDGQIVVAGYATVADEPLATDFALARYNNPDFALSFAQPAVTASPGTRRMSTKISMLMPIRDGINNKSRRQR